jgi:hypothetical protein
MNIIIYPKLFNKINLCPLPYSKKMPVTKEKSIPTIVTETELVKIFSISTLLRLKMRKGYINSGKKIMRSLR